METTLILENKSFQVDLGQSQPGCEVRGLLSQIVSFVFDKRFENVGIG